MKLKRVCICGHFGFGKTLLNGQTVKTKIVTDELEKQFGAEEIERLDTHGGVKALLKLPFAALSALRHCKNIVIMPANNGLRIITPLLSLYNVFLKRKLHYVVIGGWLASFIADKKLLTRQLKRFDGIYVETNTMKKQLKEMGFKNIYVMPNCKPLEVLSEDELVYPAAEPYKLCTFSRVMREKGIEDAIGAVKTVNEKYGKTIYTLDIYGQVDAGQIEWFSELQKSFPEYVKYGGLVPFDKSVEALKGYFALLFPTYYEGEGLAGTIIDAFAAGVPVIASDWKYNPEIVEEDITGKIFQAKNTEGLICLLEQIAQDPQKITALKKNCIKKAKHYTPQAAAQILSEILN